MPHSNGLQFKQKDRLITQQNAPYHLGQLSDWLMTKIDLGVQKAPGGGKNAIKGSKIIKSTFLFFIYF